MFLDELGHEGFFAHLQKLGYIGTSEDWFNELMRQASESDIRLFRESTMTPYYERYAGLKEFVDRVFDLALPRFDKVRAHSRSHEPSVSFDRTNVRRKNKTPRPLRMDGLALDFEDQDERCMVRVRIYVNTLLRLDRDLCFNIKEREEEDAQ